MPDKDKIDEYLRSVEPRLTKKESESIESVVVKMIEMFTEHDDEIDKATARVAELERECFELKTCIERIHPILRDALPVMNRICEERKKDIASVTATEGVKLALMVIEQTKGA